MTAFHTRMTRTLVLVTLLGVAPAPVLAQQAEAIVGRRVGLSNPQQGSATRALSLGKLPVTTRPTHWLRGGIIGGLILGAGMSTLIAGLNNASDGDRVTAGDRAGYFLGFGALGFAIGALVGAQFEK